MTRTTYVHLATIELEEGSNVDAIGAAVTVELCGHWDHEPPCRWPHNNEAFAREDGRIGFRTVFVAEPGQVREVRSRIDRGLRRGKLASAHGNAIWRTVATGSREPNDEERSLGARLAG